MNKKIAVVQLGPGKRIASARIGEYIAQRLHCDMIYDDADWKHKKYDALIVVGFTPAFVKLNRDLVGEMVRRCGTYIIVVNDYATQSEQMTQVRRACEHRGWSNKTKPPHLSLPPYVWTTVPNFVKKPGDFYVNWNLIVGDVLHPVHRQALPLQAVYKNQVVYWGAYRLDRTAQFKKYLPGAVIPCRSTKKSTKFHSLLDSDVKIVGDFDGLDELHAHGGCTVYIEDKSSQTKLFGSLATRFYEALTIGMPMLISEESLPNLTQAGYDGTPYAVTCGADIKKLSGAALKDIARRQRQEWFVDFKSAVDKQFNRPLRWLKGQI